MLLLTSTSDLVRLTTSAAVSTIEVHTSYVDVSAVAISTSKPNNAQIVIQKQPDGSYVGQRFEQTTGEINGSTTINSRA